MSADGVRQLGRVSAAAPAVPACACSCGPELSTLPLHASSCSSGCCAAQHASPALTAPVPATTRAPCLQLRHLSDLALGWNIRLRDEALDALPPSISRLDLSFCGELSDRGLAHVARLPALASLTLRKCGRLSDGGLAALSGASALTHLDLSYCPISAAGLGALRPLRRLASLALIDCLRATSPPAMMLLAQLPALEALDLSDGKRLDDGSMQVGALWLRWGGGAGGDDRAGGSGLSPSSPPPPTACPLPAGAEPRTAPAFPGLERLLQGQRPRPAGAHALRQPAPAVGGPLPAAERRRAGRAAAPPGAAAPVAPLGRRRPPRRGRGRILSGPLYTQPAPSRPVLCPVFEARPQ